MASQDALAQLRQALVVQRMCFFYKTLWNMQVYLFIFSSRIFRPKFALPEFYIQEEVADRDKPLHHSQFLQKQRLRV
jgi:hypothetical protein